MVNQAHDALEAMALRGLAPVVEDTDFDTSYEAMIYGTSLNHFFLGDDSNPNVNGLLSDLQIDVDKEGTAVVISWISINSNHAYDRRDAVRNAQQAFTNTHDWAHLVDTDMLTHSDGVHYDNASQVLLGQMVGQILINNF